MPTRTRRTTTPALAAIAVAAVTLAGVWISGGVVTNDYRASMALTGAWFAVAGVACLLLARRRRALRYPVLIAFAVTAGATGAYLAATTLQDRVVDERVIAPAAAPRAVAAAGETARTDRGPVLVAAGRFRPHEHDTTGVARIVRAPDGRRYLTLTAFRTSPGPDLRVRLVPGGSFDGGADGSLDLGALKGNRGDQQYAIPRGADIEGRTVVIWCRAFSAPFGSARPSPA